jgi:hypothetical protein
MNADTAIWIEGAGFGDAEVYVDGLMSYRLVGLDRSFDSQGVAFALRPEAGSLGTLGTVRRDSPVDPIEQIRAILSKTVR